MIRRSGTRRWALSALRRSWPIPLGAVLCALLCWGVAMSQSNSYHATAILLFHEGSISDQLVGFSSSIYVAPEREAATNDKLVELPAVAIGASKRIGDELSAKEVSDRIEVLTDPQSNIVRIVADDEDPRLAAAVANAYADSYVALRRGADQRKLRQAIRQLHTEYVRLAGGIGTRTQLETLQFGIGRLEGLAATQVGNAQIVQPASVPATAASPLSALDAALGAIVGAVFGLGMTVGLSRRGSPIRSPEDLAAATGIPVIDSLVADPPPTSATDVDDPSALAFRTFAVLAPWSQGVEHGRSIVVTGAPPTDLDKAYAAAFLAVGAAREGTDTAIVDCDILRPSLAEIFGLVDAPGIIDVLRGRCALGDALHDMTSRPGEGNFAVVCAGAATIDDRFIFDAGDPEAFKDRLGSLGFDLVVICAPSLPAPDLAPFLRSGDPVVMSYRLGTGRDVDARLVADRLRPNSTSFIAAVTTRNQMENLRDLADRESASF